MLSRFATGHECDRRMDGHNVHRKYHPCIALSDQKGLITLESKRQFIDLGLSVIGPYRTYMNCRYSFSFTSSKICAECE